jgi:hypothetical protein
MPTKAEIQIEGGDKIPCLFNPFEFTITKTATWNAPKSKGKDTRALKFQQGNPGQMSLTLTFDTTNDGTSVTDHTNKLLKLVMVGDKGSTSDNSKRPPWCQFVWGSFRSFKAVVENLQLKFTYFSSTGTPLRAQATLSLKQYDNGDKWPQNPTSGTPYPHAVRQLLPGQTLDRVAAEVYEDPAKWRVIAEANGIIDPLELPVGSSIIIPRLEVSGRG